ncbi:IS630 family transposase [Chloroflexota bacterium]
MTTTDVQLDHLLSIAKENEILYKKERAVIMLMTSLILDKQRVCEILKNPEIKIQPREKALLLGVLFGKDSFRKEKAYTILFGQLGIHKNLIAEGLSITKRTVRNYHRCYKEFGLSHLMNKNKQPEHKLDDTRLKEVVFEMLHSPPSNYGINRTTWTIPLLRESILKEECLLIGKNTISKIIKKEGYRFRKAREVLTSNDPEYKEKLGKITRILRRLGPNDRFFSIDEFGPFSVKQIAGKRRVPPGEYPTVPQWQKSKGWLIITAALELATNQITHFYSRKKDSGEMIKLLDTLLVEYAGSRRIYLSWDAASWHSSKIFLKKVKAVNRRCYRERHNTPMVKLAPLPSRAQFLNVIESIFAGLSEAIVKNSDYSSLDEAESAIDLYFDERNDFFKKNPGKAGNKIWGEEIVKPLFKQGQNCKHPRFR